ncbi:putative 2-carboxy-D-arabinitol-1-phosphatase [Gossypium australe]|uniref:Putative 2-carboxy-D-arabinitol-1-phosphatase n=1 Tax=Gossypium australe TaxID=47621 RepID=A0A5B6WBF1_9ROSI|nr:putative 2-carboxy-D-arabinitol-1-phosphatase [Gossypium australe]
MVCEALSITIPFFTNLASKDAKLATNRYNLCRSTPRIRCSSSSAEGPVTADTGAGFKHNEERSDIEGSSNLSVLTEAGVKQAERCRHALANMHFDQCFSSPISRAKTTAEVLWQGREEPLVFLDSLKEAHLFFLEGMKNVDAKVIYPKEYITWREDPANFHVNGVYPLRRLWATARDAWREILFTPGESFLVVTHKSIVRALICTALGLPPERFRSIDVNNGGMSTFVFNKRGEAMLKSLNMTAHMYSDHVYLS